jgi:hyperosmotically inducible protein
MARKPTSVLLLGALFSSSVVYAADTSTDHAGEFLDDSAITFNVKVAFSQDKSIKGGSISVWTDRGVVDLTGNVGSHGESDRATELAIKVKSVRAVHNNPETITQ